MRRDSPATVLANHVSTARFEQLPQEAIDWTTTLIEDSLGCILGALALPEARAVLTVAEPDPGTSGALAIGGKRTSVSAAAFCNSQLANLLDFDDTYDSLAPSHPGCMIIPAALAVAQSVNASAREFLLAVALGYEVALRVGRSMGNRLWDSGGPWAAVGELAAGIAAAKLYRLEAAQIRSLFSIAALGSGEFAQQPRRRIKADLTVHLESLKADFGSRTQVGVWAAMKARAGLKGMPSLLEGGFNDWYRAGLPAAGFDSLTAELREEHLITRVSLKPTPSCRWTHAPITAAWSALSGRTLEPEQVSHIRIVGVPRLERAQWSSIFDAQYSVPCAVALAVSGIEPGPKWYVDGAFKSARILELAAKVVQELDPAAEEQQIRSGRITCRAQIELKDGRKLTGVCAVAKGGADNPLTAQERSAKFAANTAHLGDRARAIKGAIEGLIETTSLEKLGAALSLACSDRN